METIYYALVAVAFFLAIGNWRAGLYACILFDAMRDPIRKLSADQPVAITVAVCVVWIGVFLGAAKTHRAELRDAMRRQFPKLRAGIQCLVVALIPGAALSVVLYQRGYLLAAIGGISYLAPLVGLAIGFLVPRNQRDIERILMFYTVLNSSLLIGAVLEYNGSDLPGLGGISMSWIRQMQGLEVNLISGFYRSPDILGLHAAHVVMFSTILALRAKGPGRFGWSTLAMWGGMCLLLAGRRKTIAIPFIFVAAYLLLSLWRGSRVSRGAIILAGVAALVTAGTLTLMREAEVSTEYTDYASTLIDRGGTRSKEIVVGSVLSTLHQSGLLGDGLGVATQGSHYVKVTVSRSGWQEDGASRLFKELGLAGVLFVGLAAILCAQALAGALNVMPAAHPAADLQLCLLCVVLGNAACFVASHQIYSGDPASSLFVVSLLGMVFGLTKVWMQQKRNWQPHLATDRPQFQHGLGSSTL